MPGGGELVAAVARLSCLPVAAHAQPTAALVAAWSSGPCSWPATRRVGRPGWPASPPTIAGTAASAISPQTCARRARPPSMRSCSGIR